MPLLAESLPQDPPRRAFVFRCGYGLAPALLLARYQNAQVIAADRDLLGTRFTRLNCSAAGERLCVQECVGLPRAPAGDPVDLIAWRCIGSLLAVGRWCLGSPSSGASSSKSERAISTSSAVGCAAPQRFTRCRNEMPAGRTVERVGNLESFPAALPPRWRSAARTTASGCGQSFFAHPLRESHQDHQSGTGGESATRKGWTAGGHLGPYNGGWRLNLFLTQRCSPLALPPPSSVGLSLAPRLAPFRSASGRRSRL